MKKTLKTSLLLLAIAPLAACNAGAKKQKECTPEQAQAVYNAILATTSAEDFAFEIPEKFTVTFEQFELYDDLTDEEPGEMLTAKYTYQWDAKTKTYYESLTYPTGTPGEEGEEPYSIIIKELDDGKFIYANVALEKYYTLTAVELFSGQEGTLEDLFVKSLYGYFANISEIGFDEEDFCFDPTGELTEEDIEGGDTFTCYYGSDNEASVQIEEKWASVYELSGTDEETGDTWSESNDSYEEHVLVVKDNAITKLREFMSYKYSTQFGEEAYAIEYAQGAEINIAQKLQVKVPDYTTYTEVIPQ